MTVQKSKDPTRTVLLTPGPTPLPNAVKQALSGDIIHHRTTEFKELFLGIQPKLQQLFQTSAPVITLACTGTGAMEASVVNLFSQHDKVLVINGGKFGERLTKICKAYGLEVCEYFVERGSAADLETLESQLDKNADAKAILFQASETSTGVRMPVEEIVALCKKKQLLSVCDGITAVGIFDLPMDELGVDVLMTGSQKAMMLPPGLAFIALSPTAWSKSETSTLPKFYFNLKREREAQAKGYTAWTPATQLIQGLDTALDMILNQEGLKNAFARHDRLAQATRAGVRALGLELLNASAPSQAVTAVKLPFSKDIGKLIPKTMSERFNVIVTGGQDELEGKIVRLSHFGACSIHDVAAGVASLGYALKEYGFECDVGEALAQCFHTFEI